MQTAWVAFSEQEGTTEGVRRSKPWVERFQPQGAGAKLQTPESNGGNYPAIEAKCTRASEDPRRLWESSQSDCEAMLTNWALGKKKKKQQRSHRDGTVPRFHTSRKSLEHRSATATSTLGDPASGASTGFGEPYSAL